jgi:mannose-6-phosphate isomerase-like protein (cupin superfamily)
VGVGDYHLVPAGVEHWLCNTSDTAPLIGPGVYIGVSGLEKSGYVHHGPVTPDDLVIAD